MSIQVIDLGTAGTQSGDTIRNAFQKVNSNFANMLFTDLKGVYVVEYITEVSDATGNIRNTSTLLTVPAGTYILIMGSRLKGSAAGNIGEIYGAFVTLGSLTNHIRHYTHNTTLYFSYTSICKVTLTESDNFFFRYRRRAGSGTSYFSNTYAIFIRIS